MPTIGNHHESQYLGNHPIPTAIVPSAGMVKSDGNELQTAVLGTDYVNQSGLNATISAYLAAVRKPVNITPAADTVGVSTTITLSGNPYYSLYGIAQSAAQFQVSTTVDFSNTVRDTTQGAVTSWIVTPALSPNTPYHWRVRYKDAENTWSEWSASTLFSTGTAIITQPSITSPTSGATGLSRTPMLTFSTFAVTGGTDTHTSSRCQVATDAGFTNVVVDSGNSATAKTSYTLGTNLNYGTTYYARVMFNGATLGGSSWSNTVNFTVRIGEVMTPSITSPISGAVGVSTSPSLTSNAFTYAGAADTHGMTDWEIRTGANGSGTVVWSSYNNSTNKVNISASGLVNLTTYYVRCRHKGNTFDWSPWSADVGFSTQAAQGQVAYTSPASYSFVVPNGVTSISAVGVGGGGGGGAGSTSGGGIGGGGGGGGALAYVNNIPVTPGETLTIDVGKNGASGSAGTQSRILRASTVLLSANGGGGGVGASGGSGGTVGVGVGGSGGTGGTGGSNPFYNGGGGGGAGGYAGSGGSGGSGSGGSGGGAGGGGAGGGGAGYASGATGSAGGGGVGLLGQGVNGYANGGGGSGGVQGETPTMGTYQGGFGGPYGGGGGGGIGQGGATGNGGGGGGGAVRIIWPGNTRQFPNTNTNNV